MADDITAAPAAVLSYGEDGYDRDGYDRDGWDRDGYDNAGYNRDGYDQNGYDQNGCNRRGYDRNGDPRNVDSGELDLSALWQAFTRYRSRFEGMALRQSVFLTYLRGITSDPAAIDNVAFCDNCHVSDWDDNLAGTGTGQSICDTCWEYWSDCDRCENRFHDLFHTLGDGNVCLDCRASYYTYCEDCDGYYPDGDAPDHNHDDDEEEDMSGCCSSPQLAFAIRNDGSEPLASDTRTVIELPAGVIDDEGLAAIRRYLVNTRLAGLYDLSYDLDVLGNEWQTRSGNYAKRLSGHAYKNHSGTKLTQEVLSQVGVIAREHSNAISVTIEITRQLNMSSTAFYNSGSCWWGSDSYGQSRCALKTNGGFALRTFDGYGNVAGRAWVLPLRRDPNRFSHPLTPTFDTMAPDAFMVFNGYGDLSSWAAPRIMALMAGWTYRKTGFACSPMYINAGGYLIAPEKIATQYSERNSLDLSVSRHSHLFADEQAALARQAMIAEAEEARRAAEATMIAEAARVARLARRRELAAARRARLAASVTTERETADVRA